MTLNEKIGIILKQHKEGEGFFNALDFMIKLELPDTGLIVSGGFGNAI